MAMTSSYGALTATVGCDCGLVACPFLCLCVVEATRTARMNHRHVLGNVCTGSIGVLRDSCKLSCSPLVSVISREADF